MTHKRYNEMREFWNCLDEPNFIEGLIPIISKYRRGILPEDKVSVRKTFGLNEPGCSVNCNYCTLAMKYTGEWNQNRIIPDVDERVERFFEEYPTSHIELVGYWYGPGRGKELEKLLGIIGRVSSKGVVGVDIGIICDRGVMERLRDFGLRYLHNNLETSRRLYPPRIGIGESRLRNKVKTLELAYECGIPITSGILIGLGESIRDIIELVRILNSLPICRVSVNFMDYRGPIRERFADVMTSMTEEYAMKVLMFLRYWLRRNVSLMVGSGVRRFIDYKRGRLDLLGIVDTLHLGSFINLDDPKSDLRSANELIERLKEHGFEVIPPPYLRL